MKKYGFVFSNLKGYRLRYSMTMIRTVLNGLLSLLPAYVLGKIVDNVVLNNEFASSADRAALLWKYIAVLAAIVLAMSVIRFINRQSCHKIAQHVSVSIRSKLYAKLQTLDASFFSQNPSGELISQMTTDVNVIQAFFSDYLYIFVRDCAMLLFSVAIIIVNSPRLALMVGAFVPVVAVLAVILHRATKTLHRTLRDKFSDINTYVNENLGAYRVVKAFAREDYEVGRLTKLSEEYRDMAVGNTQKRLNYATPIHLVSEFMRVAVLGACGIAILTNPSGSISIGDLTVFTGYVMTIAVRVREVSVIISQFQQFGVSVNKVTALYDSIPDITDGEQIEGDISKVRKIEFRDVTLILDGHMILDHVSFVVRAGETVAIMGPTGAGKTILISMLMRLYDPSCGQILINNIDIKEMDLNHLRKLIAVSTQDVFLFSDTIDGNIAYSNPDLPFEEVKQFAECAQAADFIEKLSEGYDTIIGERGVGLSGGQRQRIALARAVAKKSSIIILDDTTSAVDMETESLILKELAKITNKIKIIVAQRITSVVDADKIIVLENGRITEMGTHDELVGAGGYYTSIYNISQQGSEVV